MTDNIAWRLLLVCQTLTCRQNITSYLGTMPLNQCVFNVFNLLIYFAIYMRRGHNSIKHLQVLLVLYFQLMYDVLKSQKSIVFTENNTYFRQVAMSSSHLQPGQVSILLTHSTAQRFLPRKKDKIL